MSVCVGTDISKSDLDKRKGLLQRLSVWKLIFLRVDSIRRRKGGQARGSTGRHHVKGVLNYR